MKLNLWRGWPANWPIDGTLCTEQIHVSSAWTVLYNKSACPVHPSCTCCHRGGKYMDSCHTACGMNKLCVSAPCGESVTTGPLGIKVNLDTLSILTSFVMPNVKCCERASHNVTTMITWGTRLVCKLFEMPVVGVNRLNVTQSLHFKVVQT